MVSETRYCLQPAIRRDTARIYDLIVEAFAGSMLQYTVFQAPRSEGYLQNLVAQGPHSIHKLVVAREDTAPGARLAGYYHAVARESDFFLSYIAVARPAQGHGLGSLLMQHYEDTGRALGHRVFNLDVFDSNQRAKAWYLRRGYRQTGSDYCARLALQPMSEGKADPLVFNEAALTRALQQEVAQGFSKLDCTCNNGRLSVGLIGGQVSRLLSWEDIDLEECIRAIARRFGASRETLVVLGLREIPDAWPVVSMEKICHLSRTITANRGLKC